MVRSRECLARLRQTLVAVVATLVAVSGCGQTTGLGRNPCSVRAGGEFGSSGCADVQGSVVDTLGRPVVGVSIRILEEDQNDSQLLFNFPPGHTDSEGHFKNRATLIVRLSGSSDTATIPLTAQLRAADGSSRTAVVDVLFRFFPVGEVPKPTVVRIILPDD